MTFIFARKFAILIALIFLESAAGQPGNCPNQGLGQTCGPFQLPCNVPPAVCAGGWCCFPLGAFLPSSCFGTDCICCTGSCVNNNVCCIQNGDTRWQCGSNGDCCGGFCSPTTNFCCGVNGVSSCTSGSECCSGSCSNATEPLCCGVNGVSSCTSGSECCSGSCSSATEPLCCGNIGDACTENIECCSTECSNSTTTCCIPNGISCNGNATQCCSGTCNSHTGKCCGPLGATCASNSECCQDYCNPTTNTCDCISLELPLKRCNHTVQCCGSYPIPGPTCLLHLCILSL